MKTPYLKICRQRGTTNKWRRARGRKIRAFIRGLSLNDYILTPATSGANFCRTYDSKTGHLLQSVVEVDMKTGKAKRFEGRWVGSRFMVDYIDEGGSFFPKVVEHENPVWVNF